MAKDSAKKKKKKQKKDDGAPARSKAAATRKKSESTAAPAKQSKIGKAVKRAKQTTSRISENPVVAEVVAAALVATAAAIRDPAKARQLAAEAGADLEEAARKGSAKAELFWNMALDIARRSLDALGSNGEAEDPPKAPKQKS